MPKFATMPELKPFHAPFANRDAERREMGEAAAASSARRSHISNLLCNTSTPIAPQRRTNSIRNGRARGFQEERQMVGVLGSQSVTGPDGGQKAAEVSE